MFENKDNKEFKWNNITLKGVSRAGTGSCIVIPEYKVCFDTAQGLPFSFHMNHYLITHAHMDHAGGIPYIISQRCLSQLPPGQFYMGEEMIGPLKNIIDEWQAMEGFEYLYNFIPVEEGVNYSLGVDLYFKIFPTVHRVPSRGYTIFNKKHKLLKKYKKAEQKEIQKLVHEGVKVQEDVHTPLVSFTGDTQVEFLDLSQEVKKSKILIVECTYLDDKKSVESAREWGHIHLSELLPRLKEVESEKILLTHISRRYGVRQAEQIIRSEVARVVPELADRISLFP